MITATSKDIRVSARQRCKPVKTPVLSRVALVKDIAGIDLDLAHHSMRSLELRIAGHIEGPGLLDSSTLLVSQLCRTHMAEIA